MEKGTAVSRVLFYLHLQPAEIFKYLCGVHKSFS